MLACGPGDPSIQRAPGSYSSPAIKPRCIHTVPQRSIKEVIIKRQPLLRAPSHSSKAVLWCRSKARWSCDIMSWRHTSLTLYRRADGGTFLSSVVFFCLCVFFDINMTFILKAGMATKLKMLSCNKKKSPTTTFFHVLNYLVLFITLCPFSILALCFYQIWRSGFSYAAVTQRPGAVTQLWLYLHGESRTASGHAVNKVLLSVNCWQAPAARIP